MCEKEREIRPSHMSESTAETSNSQHTPQRDLGAAREAYLRGDVAASAAAHNLRARGGGVKTSNTNTTTGKGGGSLVAAASAALGSSEVNPSEPGHVGGATTWEKCTVYGGLEGAAITTTVIFATLASGAGPSKALIVALSCLLGIAPAFAVRDYIRYESDKEFYHREKRREEWELENFPEGEVIEMVELLQSKGVSETTAMDTMTKLSKYPKFFVDLMMAVELQMQPPDFSPVNNAITTFISIVIFGSFPCMALGIYLHMHSKDYSSQEITLIGSVVATIALLTTTLLLGFTKSNLLPQRRAFWVNALMFSACVVAAAASYVVFSYADRWISPLIGNV